MTTSLVLSDLEARLLHEILESTLRTLLLEIPHTDHRGMREGLKARKALLQGILGKLEASERSPVSA